MPKIYNHITHLLQGLFISDPPPPTSKLPRINPPQPSSPKCQMYSAPTCHLIIDDPFHIINEHFRKMHSQDMKHFNDGDNLLRESTRNVHTRKYGPRQPYKTRDKQPKPLVGSVQYTCPVVPLCIVDASLSHYVGN